MVVAFFAIPFIVRHAGVDRFALLSFAWMLLGYFSLFDLGLGKATTKQVAESFSRGDLDQTKAAIVVSTALNLGFGILFALAVHLVVPSLVRWTNVPALLEGEATRMFSYLSMSLPLLTVGGTLRCVLEGIHRFDQVNAVKAPFNSLLFLIPVVGFALSLNLPAVVLWIVVSRGLLAVLYFRFVLRHFPLFPLLRSGYVETAKMLMRFGGWVTVSNVLNPLLVFSERFMISAIVSVGAVTFYAAPYEMISRLAVIPFSLAVTLFPKFSEAKELENRNIWKDLILKPTKYLVVLLSPIALCFVFFSKEILELWLGSEFAAQSDLTLKLLSIGFFFHAFAYIALSAVQGLGRPELKAKLDVVLVVLFFTSGIALTRSYGINGAAAAKLFVLAIDSVILFWFCKSILRITMADFLAPSLSFLFLAALIGFVTGFVLESSGVSIIIRAPAFLGIVFAIAWSFWKFSFDDEERSSTKIRLMRLWTV